MEGYVYVLINGAMPQLLKIGKTKRSPEERRRELSKPSGIPVDFELVYEIYSPDMETLENRIHASLEPFRYNKRREFFVVELSEAIQIIKNEAEALRLEMNFSHKGVNELLDVYEAIEILGSLKVVYPNMIREEIKSVRVYQTKLRCYLEITEESVIRVEEAIPLIDLKIHRQDLGYIVKDTEEPWELEFSPSEAVSKNAKTFIEDFDDYSKLVCCSELFTDEAVDRIQKEYFKKERK